jgi:hypothetical protein
MKEDGVVSLWVGEAGSRDALDKYLQTGYSEEGDFIPSPFARDFSMHYYDEDLREARYYEEPSKTVADMLKGYSYENVIVPRFVGLCGESFPEPVNAVVLLYNFKYEGGVKTSVGSTVRLRYIGSVTLD